MVPCDSKGICWPSAAVAVALHCPMAGDLQRCHEVTKNMSN